MRSTVTFAWLLVLAFCGGVGAQATAAALDSTAQIAFHATFGWGDSLRLGWWTPIYISVMDQQTRGVILQVTGTQGLTGGLTIRQHAVAQPAATVFMMLYPTNDPADVVVSALDESSGRVLAWQRLEESIEMAGRHQTLHQLLGGGAAMIGISSPAGTAAALRAQWAKASLGSGFLPPRLLPQDSIAYEGVTVLMLDGIKLSELSKSQEQAILDWVRAGGNLLFWPGVDSLPQQDAIVSALPCDIGRNLTIRAATTTASSRPASNGRELTARAGAQAMTIIAQDTATVAYSKGLGLGRITVVPVDLSDVQIESAQAARAFWRGVFKGMMAVPEPPMPQIVTEEEEDKMPTLQPRSQDVSGRQRDAMRKVLALLPAAPSPTYDWRAMLGLLAILGAVAGPLDSVVLYSVGRPPRNRVTLAGWLILPLACGGYAVSALPRQVPQVHALRLVDQAEDGVVAQSELVEIAANRPQTCTLALDQNQWWQPAQPLDQPGNPFVFSDELEDLSGARASRVSLQAGQSAVLRGQRLAADARWITASLSLNDSSGHAHVAGTIRNVMSSALSGVRIVTSRGQCLALPRLEPNAIVELDVPLRDEAIGGGELLAAAAEMEPVRSDRIDQMVKDGGFVCITAQTTAPINVLDGVDTPDQPTILRATLPIK